ncbi:hypothetical protein [Legionella cincinnatiensis]|uniref:Uncharacterized protein n=1 Tax=Legionella cincinnatiensis TaxID=28085 RepID=A0A378IGX7_9GAMM|nr:hypothetical protein [Legionella cincinnatiensis]KTC82749.1 hypothetical protein Lcin_2778 [Legionella cincinnatiensis]STX34180.1 Uncharacterised protein [Legionella cincinnatiensis]
MSSSVTDIVSKIFNVEFVLKSYIQRHVKGVLPKYTYSEESGVNPAFQRIEEVDTFLRLNEKRIFALRSDFILATGVKNAEQQHGYHGLKETFEKSQYSYLNWNDRYGHPSLAIADNNYDGTVLYAGFICQRSGYLEVFLSSGRYNRCNRVEEGVLPLTKEQIHVIESYLSLKFQKAYGLQKIIFYDTTPEQDDIDSALFFKNKPFPKNKNSRIYQSSSISEAVKIAHHDSCFEKAQNYIKSNIPPVNPKYSYSDEGSINPGYQEITSIHAPLQPQEKRIWALRSDFILATGVKNAYEKEYGYMGFKDSFSKSVHSFLNWKDRYGHPSLTVPEGDYDGSAFYAGYICQRKGYLQVYLVSGRFERNDLNEEQTCILEAYIAAQFQAVYGNQEIVFDYGDSNIPSYHATFFSDKPFEKTNPQRRYNQSSIQNILQNIPIAPRKEKVEKNKLFSI